MIERAFPRRIDSLGSIIDFVGGFFASEGLPRDQTLEVELILEELFTNMVKYAREGRRPIAIALSREGTSVRLVLRDFDVERFDVTRPAAVTDEDVPIHERTPGGLGLRLVQQLADSLSYDYSDRTSTITVVRKLEV